MGTIEQSKNELIKECEKYLEFLKDRESKYMNVQDEINRTYNLIDIIKNLNKCKNEQLLSE